MSWPDHYRRQAEIWQAIAHRIDSGNEPAPGIRKHGFLSRAKDVKHAQDIADCYEQLAREYEERENEDDTRPASAKS
jgi:ribulose-5-phosphate 4-epimerase/fuculose-1-phosphate aldolase